MRNRIRAAWKVLRGEWTAHAPVQVPSAWIYNPLYPPATSATTTNATVTWTQPPTAAQVAEAQRLALIRAAARRAVRKHADALRRLSR
jgi:hypothetical protein